MRHMRYMRTCRLASGFALRVGSRKRRFDCIEREAGVSRASESSKERLTNGSWRRIERFRSRADDGVGHQASFSLKASPARARRPRRHSNAEARLARSRSGSGQAGGESGVDRADSARQILKARLQRIRLRGLVAPYCLTRKAQHVAELPLADSQRVLRLNQELCSGLRIARRPTHWMNVSYAR
jgi:hypothetical protein